MPDELLRIVGARYRLMLRDCSFIIPFIRDDIRTEIREAAAMAEAGLETDDVHKALSNAAFAGLASATL